MCDYEIQSDFDIKGLSLIDVSSEDDCLLINSPLYDHTNPQFSGCFDEHGKFEEDETRESGRRNMHKCSTWDSAFFSSAAFLEPEEFSRVEMRMSPGIQADANASTSKEASTRGSLEDDLIDQESNSDATCYSFKTQSETTDSRIVSSSNKFEHTNKHKVKHKGGPKKTTIDAKDSRKTMKQASARPQTSHSVGRSGVVSTSSVHKPPKGQSRVGPIPKTQTRRASLQPKDLNKEKDAKVMTVAGRGTTISKKSTSGDSRNIIPRPTTSSKSKLAAEGKSRVGRSQQSTFFKSPTNLNSSMSTASSYGEWSSEISSTSSANKRSNIVRSSLSSCSGSRKGLIANSDAQQAWDSLSYHTRRSSLGDDVDVTSSLDGSEVSYGSTEFFSPDFIKPSGLRAPSPKLSLFDGERSSRHTRNRSMPSYLGAPIGLPKNGEKSTNPSGSLNKAPLRTPQQSTTVATRVPSTSRNPKTSTGITPKLQNKPSPRTGKESYSKAQSIGSTEKSSGSNLPKLVVKLGGKEGARIKDTKIVPIAVPEN